MLLYTENMVRVLIKGKSHLVILDLTTCLLSYCSFQTKLQLLFGYLTLLLIFLDWYDCFILFKLWCYDRRFDVFVCACF